MSTLGMLKEEPKLLYFYEYIKQDENRVIKDGWKSSKGELVDQYRIGEVLQTEEADKNPEFYKFICTIRRAFVGDMQEKIDERMGYSVMKRYAETAGNHNRETRFKTITKVIYAEKPSLLKRIWKFLYKGNTEDLFLEKELAKDQLIIDPDEMITLEDYLNDPFNNREL